jgi:capsular polysaccharide biosynthesis protein
MTTSYETGPRSHAIDDHEASPAERARSISTVVLRRWPILVIVAGLTVIAALGLSIGAPKTFDATAKILLQPTDAVRLAVAPDSLPSPANAQRDVETNAELIKAPQVVASVRRQLHLGMSDSDLAAKVSVSGQESTNLVSITVGDRSPRRASTIASAFADAYRAYRRQSARNAIQDAIAAGLAQLAPGAAPPVNSAESTQLRDRIGQLKASEAVETGGVQVVSRAQIPSNAAGPGPLAIGLIAALVGTLLGIAAALGADRVDRRLRDPAAIERALGAPVLAEIRGGERGRWNELATRLLLGQGRRSGRALMLSRSGKEGTTAGPAAQLAAAMARLGRRVIVIEGDALRPASSPTRTGGVLEGLEAVLEGDAELSDALLEVESEPGGAHFALLKAGSGGPQGASLLAHPELPALVAEACIRADIVLVQGAPVLRTSDWAPPATACGEVVLFGGRPTAAEAAQLRRALEEFSVRAAGIVIVPRSEGGGRIPYKPATAHVRRPGARAVAHNGADPEVVHVSQATGQGG